MLPKIQNCVDAIQAGVSRVHILDGPDRTFASAGVLHQPGYRNRYYRG